MKNNERKKEKNIPEIKNLASLEFEEKILEIKRVTKIVKGGRNIKYCAIVVIGDKINRVGLGLGRGEDVNIAIQKAIINAQKNIMSIPITKHDSIPDIIYEKYGTSKIMLLPAKKGTGIIAGGALKAVLEMAGINNIVAKQLGSNNILNNAKAAIKGLIKINHTISVSLELLSKKNIFYQRALKRFKIDNL